MISGIVLSFVAAVASVLAFCLARWPMGWLKLWSPWRAFLAHPYLTPAEIRLLASVRIRAVLAGIALLIVAMILPVTGAAFFHLPRRAWGTGDDETHIPVTFRSPSAEAVLPAPGDDPLVISTPARPDEPPAWLR